MHFVDISGPRAHYKPYHSKCISLIFLPSPCHQVPLSTPTGWHRGTQGHSGTGGTHVPPVPRESLFPLLLCSVQINQLFERVCSMNQMPNQKKRLTLVGFPGRVIIYFAVGFFRFIPKVVNLPKYQPDLSYFLQFLVGHAYLCHKRACLLAPQCMSSCVTRKSM